MGRTRAHIGLLAANLFFAVNLSAVKYLTGMSIFIQYKQAVKIKNINLFCVHFRVIKKQEISFCIFKITPFGGIYFYSKDAAGWHVINSYIC